MAEKALTLVEMVITLAITAVLAATALVTLNFADGRDLDIQARSLVADLIWARELSASRHNNYIAVFDAANDTYSFYKGSVAPVNLVQKRRLTVDLVNATDWNNNALTQFIFTAPSGVASSKVLVNLRQTGRNRRINISDTTGFIRME